MRVIDHLCFFVSAFIFFFFSGSSIFVKATSIHGNFHTSFALRRNPSNLQGEILRESHNHNSYRVTHASYVVEDWIKKIEEIHHPRLNSLIVGLDIECRPMSSTHHPGRNPVAILQLCVGRKCLIFQLLYAETMSPLLNEFLENKDYTFVGGGTRDDFNLQAGFGLKVKNRINLQDLAVGNNGSIELKDIASKVLGKIIEKPLSVVMCDWSVEFLSEAQIQYACIDAFVSFEIGKEVLLSRRRPSAL